jgi:geranylgeranyl diphosphate synthase type II
MHSFQELTVQFEEQLANELLFPAAPQNLYDPCRCLLALGGKRVRPVLCAMGNELFGDIHADAWKAAMAIELFHNFTLIHDDIMDKAPLRRGQPTVHQKYGLTTGILSGDVLSIMAYRQLAGITQHLQPVLHLFNKTAIEVCEGQQLDMDYEVRNDVTIEEYIRMIELKTSVLLACSLEMGALIGGATAGNAGKIYSFGRNLGIAFQLQDDYLDAFGDVHKLGKQPGGDIKANKKTYLLIKALEGATAEQRDELNHWLQRDADSKVGSVLALFKATGAQQECLSAVKYYSGKAFNCLEEIAVISKRKAPLQKLAEFLLMRES